MFIKKLLWSDQPDTTSLGYIVDSEVNDKIRLFRLQPSPIDGKWIMKILYTDFHFGGCDAVFAAESLDDAKNRAQGFFENAVLNRFFKIEWEIEKLEKEIQNLDDLRIELAKTKKFMELPA